VVLKYGIVAEVMINSIVCKIGLILISVKLTWHFVFSMNIDVWKIPIPIETSKKRQVLVFYVGYIHELNCRTHTFCE
jgi:hypothetical protein